MKRIGITGTIASGKSMVSNYILSKGYLVVDADKIAKEITKKGEEGYIQVVREFSKDILDENNYIDRKKLSEKVFGDKKKLQKLNAILHPMIINQIEKEMDKNTDKDIVFLDAPLLFETNLEKKCHESIVVHCDKRLQIQRIIQRDHVSENQAKKIIESQMNDQEKIRRATYAIENNGTIKELYFKLEIVISVLNGEKG